MPDDKFNPDRELARVLRRSDIVVVLYPNYEKPIGFLCNRDLHRPCHALFYYATIGRATYERFISEVQAYEGDLDSSYNFETLIKSVAFLYDVSLEDMVAHWPCVSMQFHILELPMLPDEERYRFYRAQNLGRVQ